MHPLSQRAKNGVKMSRNKTLAQVVLTLLTAALASPALAEPTVTITGDAFSYAQAFSPLKRGFSGDPAVMRVENSATGDAGANVTALAVRSGVDVDGRTRTWQDMTYSSLQASGNYISSTMVFSESGATNTPVMEGWGYAEHNLIGLLQVGTSEEFPAGTPLMLEWVQNWNYGPSVELTLTDSDGPWTFASSGIHDFYVKAGDVLGLDYKASCNLAEMSSYQYSTLQFQLVGVDQSYLPEPATLGLLGTGLLAVLRRGRRA